MTRHESWVLRCNICGDCASGHGEMPEHGELWVCGQCQADFDCSMGQPVDLDGPEATI